MKIFSTSLDDDGILLVSMNVAGESMNVFNEAVMDEFTQLFQHIDSNHSIKGVVIISDKKDCFIAGADIKMLQKAESSEAATAIVTTADNMLQNISNCHKPFVAAIDGICLGAGYELSLACDYRIATTNPATKIGLPEIMLGLLPGATGTTKLSRLLPLPAALDLLLTGKQLDGKRALRAKLIDELVPSSILVSTAKAMALSLSQGDKVARKKGLLHRTMSLPLIRDFILYQAKQQVLKKTKGLYPAPLVLIDVIAKGLGKPIEQALAIEAKAFGELAATPEAKQLINIYFATTELKKETFLAEEKEVKAKNIHHLGLLGGGLMGAGIATVSIDKANTNVRIKDINDQGLFAAHQHLKHYYQKKVKRRIITKEQSNQKLNQLSGTLSYQSLKNCDLVIEAVFEDLTLKHQMVSDIEALGNENTIFASNTSSIPISDIASKAKRPENIIGMHYFSPVEKMPLLEIIAHPKLSAQTLATAVNFGRKQGKTVIVVNDGAGFYVNRILTPYLNAAFELAMAGTPLDDIDTALVNFGFPVGPFKLLDEVGLDTGSKILPVMEAAFGERMSTSGAQQKLLDSGRLGKKVKKGFYDYKNKKNNKTIDPNVYDDLGVIEKNLLAPKDIIEYCLYPLLNEATMCLEEGIIQCARDGDIGAIFGIGFPPFLGGPFRYMDSLEIDKTITTLEKLEGKHGIKYKPSEKLLSMVENKNTFY